MELEEAAKEIRSQKREKEKRLYNHNMTLRQCNDRSVLTFGQFYVCYILEKFIGHLAYTPVWPKVEGDGEC